MRIVQAYPPMIEEIDAAFNVRGKAILFAWGETIFNPAGVDVPPELVAHEKVHGRRQLGAAIHGTARGEDAVRQWWHRYIADPTFRLAEEIPAHVAEFGVLCANNRGRWRSERNMRRTLAAHVARKLSSPLYGRLIGLNEAKQLLMDASKPPAERPSALSASNSNSTHRRPP